MRRKEEMQAITNRRKTIVRIFICLLVATVLALLFSFIIDSGTIGIIRKANNLKSELAEYIVPETDIETDEYEISGTKWVAKVDNPAMIIHNVNRKVNYVKIAFCDAEKKNRGANIFWTNENIPVFTLDAVGGNYDYEGDPSLFLTCGEIAKELKIVISQPKGTELDIESIVFEPDLGKTIWKDLRKAIVYRFSNSRYYEKFKILFVSFLIVFLPCVFGLKKVFDKRWLIGFALLIFLVANKYNGDSLAVYDSYIQPGEGSQYVTPIIGEARHVRSDEWGNESPKYLSTNYLDSIFEKDNYIIRGTDTVNQHAITWYSFYNPFVLGASLIKTVLGAEYAYSYKWYSLLIFTFLINIEFFLILTNRKRLLSITSTCMIVLSSFYFWWGFPAFVTSIPSIIVCLYYFIKSKKYINKILFAFGLVAAACYYVFNLYPAWQVPSGYLMIPIILWIATQNWETIKGFKSKEWLVLLSAFVFFIISTISFLKDRSEYTTAMLNTVYPGKRFSVGGFNLHHMFNYLSAGLFPYKNLGNPSAESTCISLFPIPLICAIYYQIRNRFKDILLNGLLIHSLFILVYITIGFPEWLAKYTLMSYSPGIRAEEVFSYSGVIIFAVVFSVWGETEKIPKLVSIPIAACITAGGIYVASNQLKGYMTSDYCWFIAAFFSVVIFLLISRKKVGSRFAYIFLIIFSLITGIYVRPISKGLDSITSKPLYTAIQEIRKEEPKAKWISQGMATSGYIVACGAPCINFCNNYPNVDLWSRLDEKGIYNEEYNRFAYVDIGFTDGETSMSNPQVDILSIQLSYKDINKTEAKYIASTIPLDVKNQYVEFDCIYMERGSYIYKINIVE